MALTRKILADLGLPKEHIDAVMGSRDDILEGYHTQAQLNAAVADAVREAASQNSADITQHPDYISLQHDMATQLGAKETAMTALKRDVAVQMAVAGAKAKNVKAVMALLDASQLELQEDGTVKGLAEALEAVQKSDAYLFDAGPTPPPKPGFNPPPPAAGGNAPPQSLQDAVATYYQPKG